MEKLELLPSWLFASTVAEFIVLIFSSVFFSHYRICANIRGSNSVQNFHVTHWWIKSTSIYLFSFEYLVGSYNYEDSKNICWGVTCGLTRVHLDGAYTTVELSNCSFCFSKILYQKRSIWMSLSLSYSFLSTLFLWISKSFYFPVFACETPNSWQYRFVRGTSCYCERKQGKRKSGFTVHFVGTSRLIRRTCLMWWFLITKGRLLKFGSWEYGWVGDCQLRSLYQILSSIQCRICWDVDIIHSRQNRPCPDRINCSDCNTQRYRMSDRWQSSPSRPPAAPMTNI